MMKSLSATLVSGFSLLALSTLTACDATFHDDLSDCRHTLWVTMTQQNCATPAATPTQYKAPAGKVYLLAFDNKGILAADTTWTQTEARAVERIPFRSLNQGTYTLLGWTGIQDQAWEAQPLQRGKTRLQDVLLHHKAQPTNENQKPPLGATTTTLMDLDKSSLQVGSNKTFVKLPDPADYGSTEQEVVLNMNELNFRITAEVEVDPTTFDGKNDVSAKDFDVRVTTEQRGLRNDGSAWLDNRDAEMKGDNLIAVNYSRTDRVLTTHFTVPSLTSRGTQVRLELINRTNGKIVEAGKFDLLALLMLQNNFDPSCTREAKLRFMLRDRCLDCGEFSCFDVWADGLRLGNFKDANR